MNKRLCVKELAAAIGRGRVYVSAMRARGFVMPGGMATESEAVAWLREHPEFTQASAYPAKVPRRNKKKRSETSRNTASIAQL